MLNGQRLNKASVSYCPAKRFYVCADKARYQGKWLTVRRYQLNLGSIHQKKTGLENDLSCSFKDNFPSILSSSFKLVFLPLLAQKNEEFLNFTQGRL